MPEAPYPDAPTMNDPRQELLEVLVDSAPVAILLLREIGVIAYTNAEARNLWFEGRHPEGENFIQLLNGVPPKLRSALLSETDHIFSVEGDGGPETYHLARRQVRIAGEPHLVLALR